MGDAAGLGRPCSNWPRRMGNSGCAGQAAARREIAVSASGQICCARQKRTSSSSSNTSADDVTADSGAGDGGSGAGESCQTDSHSLERSISSALPAFSGFVERSKSRRRIAVFCLPGRGLARSRRGWHNNRRLRSPPDFPARVAWCRSSGRPWKVHLPAGRAGQGCDSGADPRGH